MIQPFADAMTADLWEERNSKAARRVPRELSPIVHRKLAAAGASATSHEVAYSFGCAPSFLVMLMRNRLLLWASAAIVLSAFGTVISGQPRDRSVAMHWRQIG